MPDASDLSRKHDRIAVLSLLLLTVIVYVLLADVPIQGDAWAYGYRTANWMVDNGLQLIPAGEDRGEQAMGHPPVFFWLWALLIAVSGNSLQLAHLLPAAGTFLALWGSYRLASELSRCRTTAFLTALAVLATPILLANSVTPLPDTAATAACTWALAAYAAGRWKRAVGLSAVALAFREQALLLVAALVLAEIVHGGWRRPWRILLMCSPVLVLVANGLAFLAVNDFFFFGKYVSSANQVSLSVLAGRLRFFMGFLFADSFRWLPVAVAAALMVRQRSGRPGLMSTLALLSPALLYPPGRLLWLAFMSLLGIGGACGRGYMPRKERLPIILFPVLLGLFHVFIVTVSADPNLNLYRYVLAGIPAVLAGTFALIRHLGGRKYLLGLGVVFIALTFGVNGQIPLRWQPETTLASVRQPLMRRDAYELAASLADTVMVTVLHQEALSEPALGYVEAPVPVISPWEELAEGVTYAAVFELHRPEEVEILDELNRRCEPTHSLVADTCLVNEHFEFGTYRIIPHRESH